MKTVLKKLMWYVSKIVIFAYYGILSVRDNFKIKKFQNVLHEKEFHGGKVMLLALYEKTLLRNDTLELLKSAKKQGIYIVAVNTMKLRPENISADLIDVYIERDNFGRDFGSYQVGMKYFYDKKLSQTCERLLIINDSVFFSVKGLDKFISDLFSTKIEVLGAAENSQHSHHLGSFCISVDGNIAKNDKFKSFWSDYKSSNVRTIVIKRGEFALSKTLKSLVSNDQQFRSLYNIQTLEKKLKEDESFYNNYFYFRREGDRAWSNKSLAKHFEEDSILYSYYDKYCQYVNDNKKKNNALLLTDENEPLAADGKVDYIDFLSFITNPNYSSSPFDHLLKERLIALYMDEFTLGSQIHINCLSMHKMGLPIIKLDLVFRCVCNMNDLIKLRDQLDESQREEFMALMSTRLCGDKFLIGLNRLAYQHGIL